MLQVLSREATDPFRGKSQIANFSLLTGTFYLHEQLKKIKTWQRLRSIKSHQYLQMAMCTSVGSGLKFDAHTSYADDYAAKDLPGGPTAPFQPRTKPLSTAKFDGTSSYAVRP